MARIINLVPELEECFSDMDNIGLSLPDDDFQKYYYLYEYTDEIEVIADNRQYPGLLNYVKTGVLTVDEMIEALTYKKG